MKLVFVLKIKFTKQIFSTLVYGVLNSKVTNQITNVLLVIRN